jgi:immunoglobulin heavy chain
MVKLNMYVNTRCSTECQHFCFAGVCCDEMDQSPSQVKRPGDKLKLSCTISGFDMTDYFMHWIRQKPGKALEWIGAINSGSTEAPYYSDSLKGHFILTEGVSTSTQFLEAKSLSSEDSAVYYCARETHWLKLLKQLYKNNPSKKASWCTASSLCVTL